MTDVSTKTAPYSRDMLMVFHAAYDKDIFNNRCIHCWISVGDYLVIWVHGRRFRIGKNEIFCSDGLLNISLLMLLNAHAYDFVKFIKEKGINAEVLKQGFRKAIGEA